MDKDEKNKRHQEIPAESISEESVLLEESEEELNNFQELQEEILKETEREIPDLDDDEEILNGMMAAVLTELSLEEPPLYQELPPDKLNEKIEEVSTEDLENCALLIDKLHAHKKSQIEYKTLVDQRRKTLSNIVQNMENVGVQNSEDDLRNTLRKVNQSFLFLREKLSDLIEEWGGDNSSEINEVLSALSAANLEGTGPAGEGNYVDVKNFRRDVVQFLMSSRIVVWDKDEERIKLAL